MEDTQRHLRMFSRSPAAQPKCWLEWTRELVRTGHQIAENSSVQLTPCCWFYEENLINANRTYRSLVLV